MIGAYTQTPDTPLSFDISAMPQSNFLNVCFLVLGVVFGWYLNEWSSRDDKAAPFGVPSENLSNTEGTLVASREMTFRGENLINERRLGTPTDQKHTASPAALPVPDRSSAGPVMDAGPSSDPLAVLTRYLSEQDYVEAIDYYAELDRERQLTNGDIFAKAKKIVFEAFSELLSAQRYEAFTDLIGAYLSTYYDDSEALLILAKYNLDRQDYFEAASVYQLVFTYVESSEAIRTSFNTFIRKSDEQLSSESRWYELFSLYQTLLNIDFNNPEYLLRQAEIHLVLDEIEQAKVVLNDIRYESKVSARVEALLKKLDKPAPRVAIRHSDYPKYRIPLRPRGRHFLVNTQLNQRADVDFMIDTGASITSISESKFKEIEQLLDAQFHGHRLFRTANGVSRADLYVVPTFRLGQMELKNIQIAVLPNLGGHGLLGMNVLRRFRFEINQDEKSLWLGDRQ